MVVLLIWFIFVTPSFILQFGKGAFRFHSVLGLIFVTLSLLWTADYMRRGLASRPGPKLPPWARKMHRLLHLTLIWGLFGVALTGFFLGLTSAVLLKAGGFMPVAPPMDMPQSNDIIGQIHIYEFYLLAADRDCPCRFPHLAPCKAARQCASNHGAPRPSPISLRP